MGYTSITSVWNCNLLQALYDIDKGMNMFPVVSVDTEFPGLLVTTSRDASQLERYKNLKFSIDRTNIIQLGVTLSTEAGHVYRTWEFNFKFDLCKENFNEDSIKFLEKNGLKLEKLKRYGIDIGKFSNLFGRIMSNHQNVEWITFHGVHDMAHLLKLITNSQLPETESEFAEMAGRVFGSVVDVKYVATLCEDLEGGAMGLEKLANKLGVARYGGAHIAGSDSLLTAMVYGSMRSAYGLVDKNEYSSFLYGISAKIETVTPPIQYLPLPHNCVPCFPLPLLMTSHYYLPFY